MTAADSQTRQQINRRRTFAIISHPDAGKTTLTEKLLLFGGCIEIAGTVRGRKAQRAATSDWMELEKQRGISITSTVLSFEYRDCLVNLLDTPGHHDFSEDTYRTLMAADCAVMVIDLAKGVETQTEKLFRVCAMRKMPVITFVNKVDRPGKDPLEILTEIESKFGIEAVPLNWPLGTAHEFSGVVDIQTRTAHLSEQGGASRRTHARTVSLAQLAGGETDGTIPAELAALARHVEEEIELVAEAGTEFDQQQYLEGRQTPVFFGSALTNFGVEQFLEGFLDLCPTPRGRTADAGVIPPEQEEFTGFVFKIQANLDPRHRDRIAFVRICSGKFRRDMEVLHTRTKRKIRLKRAMKVFGQDRETMEEAFAGDIIGLINPGEFRLGDTISERSTFHFEPLPQFSPENFAVLQCRDADRRKQFRRGLTQLIEEGAIQLFADFNASQSDPILAAVGELQFDVVRYRLESEYDTPTELRWLPYKLTRWIEGEIEDPTELKLPYTAKLVRDQYGHYAVLFQAQWDTDFAAKENPQVTFHSVRMGMRGGFDELRV